VLFRSRGADSFIFNADKVQGRDLITDFELEKDHIRILNATYADLTISTVNLGTKIAYDGGAIVLEGISADQITEDNFVFT